MALWTRQRYVNPLPFACDLRTNTNTHHQLSHGISLLCRGSSEDKIRAAFDLFDKRDTGRISRSELESYLTTTFRVRHTHSTHSTYTHSVL